jgi:DNA processing protein
MQEELIFRIALTQVPNVGDMVARSLLEAFGSAKAIFHTPYRKLECIEGVGSVRARSIHTFRDFTIAEKESVFIEKNKIQTLFINDNDYPKALRFCPDAPALLYLKGNKNALSKNSVAVIGTRNHSAYGKEWCQQFIHDLKEQDIHIISGLAYGIDSIAHQSALDAGLSTSAILAHGLDRIYPETNRRMAIDMQEKGMLITEFMSGIQPDKQNFPRRNRITAGCCEAVVIVETGLSGGSMITAELAHQYNRELFALPGRVTDVKSMGCHQLIRQNKAQIITSAKDLLDSMGWNKTTQKKATTQLTLPLDMSPDETTILKLLVENREMHIDELSLQTGFSSGLLSTVLLNLEMNQRIISLPGKKFKWMENGFNRR